MPDIEMSINNPFATQVLRSDAEPTALQRAFARLIRDRKNPGKIIPIIVQIDGDYRSFGALTLNGGGSFSFFPDLLHFEAFDHVTLNNNFQNKHGHWTIVTDDGKHERGQHIEAGQLNDSVWSFLYAFCLQDGTLLADSLPELVLPALSYSSLTEQQQYQAWLTETVSAGQLIVEFPEGEGFHCLQFFVRPKGAQAGIPAINRTPIEMALESPGLLKDKTFPTSIYYVATPDNCTFEVAVAAFRVDGELSTPAAFTMVSSVQP